MIHFVVYMLDKPGTKDLRERVRPAHIAFIRSLGRKVKAGGPLLAEDAETKIGGMYILEEEDLQAARRIVEGDPYVTSGLSNLVEVRGWRWQTDNR